MSIPSGEGPFRKWPQEPPKGIPTRTPPKNIKGTPPTNKLPSPQPQAVPIPKQPEQNKGQPIPAGKVKVPEIFASRPTPPAFPSTEPRQFNPLRKIETSPTQKEVSPAVTPSKQETPSLVPPRTNLSNFNTEVPRTTELPSPRKVHFQLPPESISEMNSVEQPPIQPLSPPIPPPRNPEKIQRVLEEKKMSRQGRLLSMTDDEVAKLSSLQKEARKEQIKSLGKPSRSIRLSNEGLPASPQVSSEEAFTRGEAVGRTAGGAVELKKVQHGLRILAEPDRPYLTHAPALLEIVNLSVEERKKFPDEINTKIESFLNARSAIKENKAPLIKFLKLLSPLAIGAGTILICLTCLAGMTIVASNPFTIAFGAILLAGGMGFSTFCAIKMFKASKGTAEEKHLKIHLRKQLERLKKVHVMLDQQWGELRDPIKHPGAEEWTKFYMNQKKFYFEMEKMITEALEEDKIPDEEKMMELHSLYADFEVLYTQLAKDARIQKFRDVLSMVMVGKIIQA